MTIESNSEAHRFQINLAGLIDVLSNHLYTRPDVFVRELLQNGADAIRAFSNREPGYQGCIDVRLRPDAGEVSFIDNGIGLTEDEMHRFLAVIGESSKRGELFGVPDDFIGQFGIGLLACFMVADEIEVTSRSVATPNAPAMIWRGRPDGTYTVVKADGHPASGTRVTLRAKPGAASLLQRKTFAASLRHYGGLLPWPVRLHCEGETFAINDPGVDARLPWDVSSLPPDLRVDHLLDYGRQTIQAPIFDAIPLESATGGISGVAYVLENAQALSGKRQHRVYLKRMLLSEDVDNLLPPWAFFVRCVVNCTKLRPTAARNAFFQDDALAQTQAELGECLQRYLARLASQDPKRLERLIATHFLALKSLAVEDESFFRLFAKWLPFESNFGRGSLQSYLARNHRILVARTVDEFRQIAQVARAQDLDVINGGYAYDAELLVRYGEINPDTPVRFVEPSDIGHRLKDIGAALAERYSNFMNMAQAVLEPFACMPRLKIFEPDEVSTLFIADQDALLGRRVAAAEDVADDLWGNVLAAVKPEQNSELCLNYGNAMIRSLAEQTDAALVQRVVKILYVQALLMGHYPLGAKEIQLLNEGLSGLLESSLVPGSEVVRWH